MLKRIRHLGTEPIDCTSFSKKITQGPSEKGRDTWRKSALKDSAGERYPRQGGLYGVAVAGEANGKKTSSKTYHVRDPKRGRYKNAG